MLNRPFQTSPQIYARIAGFLYLALVPLGFIGMAITSGVVVPADAAATARNILSSEAQIRLSIVLALLVQVVNIFVVLTLYRLLKPVNKDMAALMVIFLLLGVPIAMLNELNQLAVLVLLHSTTTSAGFAPGQLQAFVPWLLNLHQLGISIAGIFWGLWLFPMGYLVFKSGFLPRIIGILLIIGCLGYLTDSITAILLPSIGVNIAMYTFWGEVILPLWLVIKGVNVEQWEKQALVSS